jgi:hypothetical protein
VRSAKPSAIAVFRLGDPVSRNFRVDLQAGGDPFEVVKGEVAKPVMLAVWAMGRGHPKDIVWTTHVGPMLMSQRAMSLLEDCGASGWSAAPCEARG